jgi:uncharacterized phage protein (TIGR02218 family)
MRPVTPALDALLQNWTPLSDIKMADLYTWSLAGGEVFYFAEWQTALAAPLPNTTGPLVTFARGPRFKRSKVREEVGVTVGELEVEVYACACDLLGTLTWQQALHAGLFDGAYCELDRAYMQRPNTASPYTVAGTVERFYGPVGDVTFGRTKCVIHVKSQLDKLTIQMPKRLFQAPCGWVFGGPGCGYDRTGGNNALGAATGLGAVAVTALAGSAPAQIATGFTPSPSTAYDQGSIIGTSGQNNGLTRTLRQLVGGVAYLFEPWIYPVATGDGFRLLPGCDHTLPTCQNTFDNIARYGGFPYVPPPESAI